MPQPRVLILSVSAGAGHLRAADALRQAAAARGWEARHIDVMELVPSLFRTLYASSFITLVNRSPALWGYLYHASDRARPDSTLSRLRRAIERLNTRRLAAAIAEAAPTHIVCTHFLPAELCVRLRQRGRIAARLGTVATDFDIHALWVQPEVDAYAVAADEVAWRLRDRLAERQAPALPIHVTGIPIAAGFADPPGRAAAAAALGLAGEALTILLMSGGMGVGAIDRLAERILRIDRPLRVIAMAGRNRDLLGRLRGLAQAHPGRLLAQGFTDRPELVMAAADLAVTKPGGLTTSECLALGLPMLIVAPIPGQEERNSDHILERGAGMKAHDLAGVEYRVRALLDDPARLAGLRRAAAACGRPRAAAAALDALVGSA